MKFTILTELWMATKYDLTQWVERVCQRINERWPDVDAYYEPEVATRPCVRPPPMPQLRATKTPYLSVVVDNES